MVQDGGDKGVGFKDTANLLKVLLLLHLGTIGPKTGHGGKAELLTGILVQLAVQAYHSLFPLLDN